MRRKRARFSKLAEKCGPCAVLKVLRKRELENYLLLPRVVKEFIALKQKLADPAASTPVPSEPEVVKQIDEVAEKLKNLAIEKRVLRSVCRPVYPATRRLFAGGNAVGMATIEDEVAKSIKELEVSKASIQQAYAEQTKLVENKWSEDKLSLVPGDLLLDGVCQAFGVRFRKDADSSRAAALLNQSEFDDEIRQILQEIGSPT